MWNDAIPDRTAQQAMKRKAILRAAAMVFTRQGSHGATLEDVAISLGVSKAALYRYVLNKNELVLACQEEALDIADKALTQGEKEGLNALDKIRIGLTNYLIEMIAELGVPALILEDNALHGAEAEQTYEKRDAYEMRMRRLVRDGIADGSIVATEPKIAVFMLLGSIHWVSKWYRPEGNWTPEMVAHAIVEIATRALDARPAPTLTTRLEDIARPAQAPLSYLKEDHAL
ncbi:TetR/AcrR family transcriptional regulator [Seohaeicola zhoushanensis]|uniref:TetR family transcriptional regulator n=1 Tax=Seohaeicola zhoushanensis TaxID=1569283 RepID=A0A8J3M9E6_9RHOB|nr:TetR/AcrR family transcriptional regulator [Seohaeicola zhoushanensis]GHF60392.1 TetR family transcriptional regulator [Seohaeicola zhoushanensis]